MAVQELANLVAEGEAGRADDRVTQIASRALFSENYVGAFPHPRNLREFDKIVEGGAERAFQLTEREQAHRHKCDDKVIDAEIASRKAADADRRILVVMVSLVAFIGIISAVVLLALDKNVGAGIFGSVSVLSVLVASYFGRGRPSKEGRE